PHGRASLGILIFQDLAVVPMVLAVPLLAGNGGGWSGPEALMAAGRMVGVFLFLWAASRYVVPHLLYQVARTRSREIFLFSVIVIVLATAWLTQEAGLSLALGAFLAGLMISESEYNHQALASILPFRDVFASFFFVSIGMMFSPGILVTHPLQVAGLTLFIILAKSLVTVLAGLVAGLTIRTSVLAGLFLAQVGEFSFILSESGMEYGLLSQDAYGLFLVCSVLTMAISPALAAVAPAVARWSQTLPLPARLKREAGPEPGDALAHRENHLVIVGYGVNGRNVSAAARYAGVPYVIVEMNPDTVRTEKARGEPILFGDASMPVVLSHAGLERARVAVVAINDPAATRAAVQNIKEKNPSVHLIVRTRFVNEITPLRDLGADEVIPEEFETSVEIFSRVLNRYQVPESDIREMVDRVRGDTYGMLRSLALAPGSGAVLPDLADSRISTLRVCPGSRLEGRSLAETALRKKHGVTVLAVRRDGATLANPDPDQRFIAGDALVVLGTPADIRSVSPLVAAKDGLPAGEPSKSG
ncbi:MAG: cation:proton antiporter, partial [Pseudomonadota bacterium]